MKAKTHLTLQRSKNPYRKRKITSRVTLNPIKSPFKQTPLKSPYKSYSTKSSFKQTPLKSPYKSPLYKASPANKKRKVGSSRRLFQDSCCASDNQNSYLQLPIVTTHTGQNNVNTENEIFTINDVASNNDLTECVVIQTDSRERKCELMSSFQEIPPEYTAYPLTHLNANDENNTPKSNCQNTEKNERLKNEQKIEEMKQILPEVMNELASHGNLDESMLLFFRQVKNHKFPLTNIAFQLWLEVVKWHENKSTTNMRYTDITKMFWKLGWRAFGERFINFMGGFKSHGNLIQRTDQPGEYSPENSEVNFAVPDIKVLRHFDLSNVGGERRPGIYNDMMTFLSSSMVHQSTCLTFDGKKLKMGLTEDSGDVDLLGHETDKTLSEKKNCLTEHIQELNDMQAKLTTFETDVSSIDDLPNDSKTDVLNLLIKTIKRLSTDIFQVREIRRKKEYCKTKLIERGGATHWRKGKYVYAISAIIAFLHDIDEFLNQACDVLEEIEEIVAFLNNHSFVSSNTTNIENHPDYVAIPKQKEDIKRHEQNTRLLNQRTPEWLELRKAAKVTGSTLFAALGGEGLKRQQDHFDKVICGVPELERSEEQKKAMNHGVINEINAIATVVGKVLPVFEPDLKFYEEGCSTVLTEDSEIFMVVSPDGSLRMNASFETTKVAIEIKCPYYSIHSRFPHRYLLQCLSEIEVLDVPYLLFVSWTPEETTVFSVPRDQPLFQDAMKLALKMYGEENVKKPTKYSEEQKELKKKLEERSKSVQMIGRFKSIVHSNTEPDMEPFKSRSISVQKLVATIHEVKILTENHYEINRERASEAVVYLLCDLDRSWDKERVKWAPVAWFPKGYSLTTKTIRDITEEVHTCAHNNGIHVPCSSFDGQWHGIVIRSTDNKPLTILQLQKDVWNSVIKMSKCDIISEVRKLNRTPTWNRIEVSNGNESSHEPKKHIIVATYQKIFPQYRKNQTSRIDEDKKKQQASTATDIEPQPSLAESIPQHVADTSDTSCDVLKMTLIEEREEFEAFRSNIREDLWAEKMIEDQDCSTVELQIDNAATSSRSETLTRSNETCSNVNKSIAENITLPILTLQEDDTSCILSMFKTTKDSNKNFKWDNVTSSDLLAKFKSLNELKTFLDIELKVIVRYLRKTKGVKIKESVTKKTKIAELSKLFGLDDVIGNSCENRRVIKRRVDSLARLALKVITKTHSKYELSVWFSENQWQEKYQTWDMDIKDVTINGNKCTWFYKPDYSKTRKQFEVRCIDSTHLLTRSRQKSCRGGLDGYSNEPWRAVAATKKTLLTKIMVDEVIDPMSVQMAKTHFSEEVESLMRCNNDIGCADLCRDIRNWWQSEDCPGIPANERIKLREGLRNRLLNFANFSKFPPATVAMNGWPLQLWEAMLANIDAKALLYGLCHRGTYNVRSFSSMMGETFFSELVLHDKAGKGAVTSKEFGRFIGATVEKVQARLDPKRTFAYRTSKNNVYDLVEECETFLGEADVKNCIPCVADKSLLPKKIIPEDHSFDKAGRKRLKGRSKPETVSSSRNAVQRGALGVRWERARRNEAKMLPTDRMGIDGN